MKTKKWCEDTFLGQILPPKFVFGPGVLSIIFGKLLGFGPLFFPNPDPQIFTVWSAGTPSGGVWAAQGEGVAEGVLLRALEHYRGRSAPYSSLAHIAEHYAERSGMFTRETVPQLRAVLYDMDHPFCQPTADAAREEWEGRFDEL